MAKKKQVEKEQKLLLSPLDWCNQQYDLGKELKLIWEGGGDSGWAHFEVDDEDVDNVYTRFLVDHIYDELDYGSWAGEFSANGDAIYNKEEQSFAGIDYYSEDSDSTVNINLNIKVPEYVNFDSLHIIIDDDGSGGSGLVEFEIKNGFFTTDISVEEEKLQTYIDESITQIIEDFSKTEEFRSIYFDDTYQRSQFTKTDDGMLTLTIESVDIGTYNTTENTIYLEVANFTEPIAENNE